MSSAYPYDKVLVLYVTQDAHDLQRVHVFSDSRFLNVKLKWRRECRAIFSEEVAKFWLRNPFASKRNAELSRCMWTEWRNMALFSCKLESPSHYFITSEQGFPNFSTIGLKTSADMFVQLYTLWAAWKDWKDHTVTEHSWPLLKSPFPAPSLLAQISVQLFKVSLQPSDHNHTWPLWQDFLLPDTAKAYLYFSHG